MKKLHAWLMKLTFGIDLKCDLCHPPTYWKTERGMHIHKASHYKHLKYKITAFNSTGKRIIGNVHGIKFVADKRVPRNQVVVKYGHNPLEGQDVELWLRKNETNKYQQSR